MNQKKMTNIHQILTMIVLIVIGTLSRYIFIGYGLQPFPNFELIMIVTFLAALLIKPTFAIIVPLSCMILSDILIGNPIFIGNQMNRIVIFTYTGFALIAVINIMFQEKLSPLFSKITIKTTGMVAGISIGFVLLYDIWTNFGWWYLMYPHNPSTFATVYLLGIPFMIYHIISGIVTFIVIGIPFMIFLQNRYDLTLPLKKPHLQKLPVLALSLILIVLSFSGTAARVPEKQDISLQDHDETTVHIVFMSEQWTVTDYLVAGNDETVFTILQKMSKRNDFNVEFTYYEEFDAILIDSINNIENGAEGKYWQYYVNGDIPMVGADNYPVENGDYIEWRFEIVPYEF